MNTTSNRTAPPANRKAGCFSSHFSTIFVACRAARSMLSGAILPLSRYLLPLILLVHGAGSLNAANQISIGRITAPNFFYDITKSNYLVCNYAQYAITNVSASTLSNLWVKVDTFSGTNIGYPPGASGLHNLGNLAAGAGSTEASFFLFATNDVAGSAESHKIRVYQGYPDSGGVELTNVGFTLTISDVAYNNANKVNAVSYAPSQPVLGGTFVITVDGETSTTKLNDPLSFVPGATTNWNVRCFDFIASVVSLTNSGTFAFSTNILAFLDPISGTKHYTYRSQYTFRASAISTTNSPIYPDAAFGSVNGQQTNWAHSVVQAGAIPPILPATNGILLTMAGTPSPVYMSNSVTTALGYTNVVSYTLRFTNASDQAISVDRVVDTLPTNFTYVTGSGSTFAGAPVLTNGQAIWSEPIPLAAFAVVTLTFQAAPTSGYTNAYSVATNSAVAYIGPEKIDTTYSTTDNAPATNMVQVIWPASQLVFTNTPVTTTAGQASSIITVQRLDQYGNPQTNDPNRTITLSSGSTGTFSFATNGTSTTSAIIPSGSSTVSFTYTDTKSGTPTITVASTSPSTLTSITQTETVTAATATRFVISGNGTQTAGSSQNLTITAYDTYGNVATSYTGDHSLTFTGANSATNPVTAPTIKDKNGTAVAFGTGETITFVNGVATVSGGNNGAMTLYKAETATIHVSDGSITSSGGGDLPVTVSATTASKLVYTTVPSTGTAGTAFSVTVASEDAYGNLASPTSGTTVTLSKATGAGTLSGTLTGTIGTGATSVTINTPVYSKADTMTLTATATAGMTSLGSVTSGGITFSSGAVNALQSTVSASPGSVTADGTTTSTVTVTLRDANGNPVAGKAVSLAKTSGPGSPTITTTQGTTDASGAATFTVKSTTAGDDVFTATDTTDSLTVTQTASVTFVPGTATRFVIGGSSSQTAGSSQNLTITAYDSNGNIATNYTGDHSMTFSGANSSTSPVTAPTVKDKNGTAVAFGTAETITFVNGVATVSSGNNGAMTLYKAEAATIHVTDGSISSSGGGDLSVTVSASSTSKLAYTTSPVTVALGSTSSTITVQRQDQYGNPVTAEADRSVGLSSNSGGPVTFTTNSVATTSAMIPSGSSSVSFTYKDMQAGSPTITASSTSPTSATSATQQETINKLTSSFAVNPASVTYGDSVVHLTGTVSASSASGTLYPTNGDVVRVTINGVTQTATISGGSGGFSLDFPTATLPYLSGGYTITYNYDGSSNLNAASDTSTKLTVNKATLNVTATAQTKTYGSTLTLGTGQTAFSSSGLKNGESIGTVTLGASGGTTANSAVGGYTLTPSAATGGTFNAANYSITYNTGTLTVNSLPIDLTGSRFYDGTYTAYSSNLGVTNKVTGDDLTLSGSVTLASRDIGSQSVSSFSSLTLGGTSAGNYTKTSATGSVTISDTKSDTGITTIDSANSADFNLYLNAGKLLASNDPTDGSINGTGTNVVGSSATLAGTGKVGAVTVNSQGTISAGDTSVGTLTTASEIWASGGTNLVQIANATGTKGTTGWDWLDIAGGLDISATTGSKFTIALSTPAEGAANFSSGSCYAWPIATASGGITGFDPAKFTVDTTAFQNTWSGSGAFSVSNYNNSIYVVYTPNCVAPGKATNWLQSGNITMHVAFTNASGLVSVKAQTMVNCTVTCTSFSITGAQLATGQSVPADSSKLALPPGTTGVEILAVRTNTTARLNLLAYNACNVTGGTDPTLLSLVIGPDGVAETIVDDVPQAEHYLQVINGLPGLRSLAVAANGRTMPLAPLADNSYLSTDIEPLLVEGENTLIFTASGEPGARAVIMLADTPASAAIATPTLTAKQTADGLELTWLGTAGQWQLQSTPAIVSAWENHSTTPSVQNGLNRVIEKLGASNRFYRLQAASASATTAAPSSASITTALPAPAQPQQKQNYGDITW